MPPRRAPAAHSERIGGSHGIRTALAGKLPDLLSLVKAAGSADDAVRLLDSHDENGCTPLHLAVIGGHEHVLEYLIDAGVDVSSARRLRRTGCHARVAIGTMSRDAVHSSECRAGLCYRAGFLKI